MTSTDVAAFCDECGSPLSATTVCPRCSTPVTVTPSRNQRPRAPLARVNVRSAMRHNRAGTLVGLVAAWFNVPLVLFMAGIGAVFGGLVGLFSGSLAGPGVLDRLGTVFSVFIPLPIDVAELLPTAAVQVGGIIGALLGMVTGALKLAWLTFSGAWVLLHMGDPLWPWMVACGQVATAVFLGVLYTFYSTTTEAWRLRLAGVRRPSRRESAWLEPIVRQAAKRIGATSAPILRIDDSREPNATAGARHIIINQGLLEFLNYDDDAVAGVIAHEVAHWHHGDPVAMAWGKGVALPLYLAHNLAVRVQEAARWGPLRILVWVVLWSVSATMRGLVVPLHARYWRRCEYAADAAAARAGYGPGLYRALSLIRRSFDGARTGWDQSMLATHPPTELRLERLEAHGLDASSPYGSTARAITRPDLPRRSPDKD